MMKHKKRTAKVLTTKGSSNKNTINKTLAFFKVFVNSDYFIPLVMSVLFLILMRIAVLTGRLIALVNV
ncbi:hypothetical protein [Anaerofustis stercorihominis]|uniref:Uncharacterized protein n=1 Tax=Anaerofustis stercorihominis TaxID=214853 RepID=A0A3E3DX45_9FIRM|nr:hypothetical protein [Anaerofustis stercorihominis]RGD73847.1 hypothetical protein DW687_08715 [Anaerofustis stercorihominis]